MRSAPGFLLAGLRRHHGYGEMRRTIPQQWQDFLTMGAFVGQSGGERYGAICSASDAEVEYLTGVQVEAFDALPAEIGRMRVPPQQYAVFMHQGGVSTLWETWRWIWTSWMPNSGYRDAPTPAFELYAEDFDPQAGDGEVEIWFSIEERG